MKRSTTLLFAGMLLLTAGMPTRAADPPTAGEAAAKETKDPAGKSDGKEKKGADRVRYAELYVQLAKLDLKMAQNRNRDVPNTIPQSILIVMEEHVALAELWLEQEKAEVTGKMSPAAAVKMAEIHRRVAEMRYTQLQEANRISRLPADRLERARLQVEMAKLNVAAAKDLDPDKPEEFLEYELERLREEVTELYVRQLKLLDRN
ncbi:MAG TPA: hypothetical protein VMF30_09405 [Pirellulales bacterium]|nr:hypothetical protein [Pirellulales bacterium]